MVEYGMTKHAYLLTSQHNAVKLVFLLSQLILDTWQNRKRISDGNKQTYL